MTEKLKVSREVAEALEKLNRKELSTSTWLEMHSHKKWESAEKAPLNTLSLEEFATALIVGYETEMTPHELIAEDYKDVLRKRDATFDSHKERFFDGYTLGIETTLEYLKITVEGVNDHDKRAIRRD